jgi:hypothetical protein
MLLPPAHFGGACALNVLNDSGLIVRPVEEMLSFSFVGYKLKIQLASIENLRRSGSGARLSCELSQ